MENADLITTALSRVQSFLATTGYGKDQQSNEDVDRLGEAVNLISAAGLDTRYGIGSGKEQKPKYKLLENTPTREELFPFIRQDGWGEECELSLSVVIAATLEELVEDNDGYHTLALSLLKPDDHILELDNVEIKIVGCTPDTLDEYGVVHLQIEAAVYEFKMDDDTWNIYEAMARKHRGENPHYDTDEEAETQTAE
jgi:hypothetical protein